MHSFSLITVTLPDCLLLSSPGVSSLLPCSGCPPHSLCLHPLHLVPCLPSFCLPTLCSISSPSSPICFVPLSPGSVSHSLHETPWPPCPHSVPSSWHHSPLSPVCVLIASSFIYLIPHLHQSPFLLCPVSSPRSLHRSHLLTESLSGSLQLPLSRLRLPLPATGLRSLAF